MWIKRQTCPELSTRSPEALTLCLATCQIGPIPNSNAAEVTNSPLILILTFKGQNYLGLDKGLSKYALYTDTRSTGVLRIYCTGVPGSLISVRFTLQAVFELHGVLRWFHLMTPKRPWTLEGQVYHIYVLLVPPPPSAKFQSISLCVEPFFELEAI